MVNPDRTERVAMEVAASYRFAADGYRGELRVTWPGPRLAVGRIVAPCEGGEPARSHGTSRPELTDSKDRLRRTILAHTRIGSIVASCRKDTSCLSASPVGGYSLRCGR